METELETCLVCGGQVLRGMPHSNQCIKNATEENMQMVEDKLKELSVRLDSITSRKIEELSRVKMLSKKFYDDVLPQIGKLCIQDYEALNELGILLGKE